MEEEGPGCFFVKLQTVEVQFNFAHKRRAEALAFVNALFLLADMHIPCYRVSDPLHQLPEEVVIVVGAQGVNIKGGGTRSIIRKDWSDVLSSHLDVSTGDEMDLFVFAVKHDAPWLKDNQVSLTFECDGNDGKHLACAFDWATRTAARGSVLI